VRNYFQSPACRTRIRLLVVTIAQLDNWIGRACASVRVRLLAPLLGASYASRRLRIVIALAVCAVISVTAVALE
jgi:hypothetical protein